MRFTYASGASSSPLNYSSSRAEETCGEELDASQAGYITSPGYPHEYPPHQHCKWIITAPEPSQRIVLNFNPHFELERLDCRYDFIEIRDGNSDSADLLGKHCSNIAPPAIISSGPVLMIKFVSDYAHQGAGFSLRYEILKTGSDCSKNFTSLSGVIESPGFPDKYPHNLECVFIIIVPPRMEVTLKFLTFDLENDPLNVGEGECKYDWLEIWDGLPQVGPVIGRYCGVKIPPEIHSSTGILSLTFRTDMAVAKDGFSARYNMTYKEASDTFHCSSPFGMESGEISDEQISSSSTFYDGRWSPKQARLNNEDNAWTPSEDSNKEYIQVDLNFLKVLTGIATQGAISKETHRIYYVTTFKLEVSTNGEDWMIYRHGKNHKASLNIMSSGGVKTPLEKVFHANTDPTEVVLNRIPQPVLARFVRIRPQTWENGIALRFELYGCQITDAPCSDLQGMLSGLIPDSQISASSTRDMHWSPGAARLVASRSGWFPRASQPLAGEEWLQVDLGLPKMVRGVITQGTRGGEGSTENRAFVRRYRVAYSMNGKDWDYIIDPRTMHHKIFEGNTNYDTPEIRRFEEVMAQYVRIYPERWSPAGIGMRLEIVGCDPLGAQRSRIPLPAAGFEPATFQPQAQAQILSHSATTPSRIEVSYPTNVQSSAIGIICILNEIKCNCKSDVNSKPTSIADMATPTVHRENHTTTVQAPCVGDPSRCSKDSQAIELTPLGLVTPFAPNVFPVTTTASSGNSLCDFEQNLCGWTHDPVSDFNWSLHSGSGTLGLGPSQDLFLGSDEYGNYLYIEGSQKTEGQHARLVSPVVAAEKGLLCLVFWYRMKGDDVGPLQVRMRDADLEETVLWELKGDQGSSWSEGRTVLPRSPKEYQVVMDGFIDHGTRGNIWIDNIDMTSSIPLEECTQPISAFRPDMTVRPSPIYTKGVELFEQLCGQELKSLQPYNVFYLHPIFRTLVPSGHLSFTDSKIIQLWRHADKCRFTTGIKHSQATDRTPDCKEEPDGGFPSARPSLDPAATRTPEKDNSWLYTLDPILVTIIAMSSLGVLLGAICAGLLLYCTCSYNGLSSRSSTTLENYNFELYDGIKHKVKINQQKCCSEA
ncbi:NRP2 protein, partial [Atractosteus spatula]|nr:NRP2 protein [Atractosteus spatula]